MHALLALLVVPSLQGQPTDTLGGDFDLVSSLGFGSASIPGSASTGDIAIADANTRYYGYSSQSPLGPLATIERRDGNHDLVWSSTISFGANVLDVAGLELVAGGGVIATLNVVEAPFFNASKLAVVRIDGGGNTLWTTEIDGDPQGTSQMPSAISAKCSAPGVLGGVFIGGVRSGPLVGFGATIYPVTGDGARLPSFLPFGTEPADVYDIEPLAGGGCLVSSGTPAGNRVARFDVNFDPVWSRTYGAANPDLDPSTGRFVRELVQDELGDIYANFSYQGGGTRVVRLNPDSGDVIWSVNPVPASLGGRADGLTARPGGGVWSTGYRNFGFAGPSAGEVVYVRSLSSDAATIGQDLDFTQPFGTGIRLRGAEFAFGSFFLHGTSRAPRIGEPIVNAFLDYAYLVELKPSAPIGETYCSPVLMNSSARFGEIQAFGSEVAAEDDVALVARRLPMNQFGLFVSGSDRGVTPLQGGSSAALCITGNLGRFSDSLASTTRAGVLRYRVDTSAIPTALGPIAATAGLEWHFQCWHRDFPFFSPSNTTNAVTVRFR